VTNPVGAPEAGWWRDAVIYQIYLRSFADGDGDGIGDLGGLRSRLDYLAELGVDGLWLNPCYPSPQADHGYDIADHTDIDPVYGDLAAFDGLLREARRRGLKVLMDLVPNHCSTAHPWFAAALAAAPGSAERARFVFRDGRGSSGGEPPNNWRSVFGGPAWTRVTDPGGRPGQWYLHLFDPAQPDFDWRNPQVVEGFDEVLRFWFDRGVDGFRIDVAHGLIKRAELPDWDGGSYNAHAWNQPEVHELYRRWRRLAAEYEQDRELTFVGEIWVPTVEDLARYLRPDELPQAFFFDLLLQPWAAREWRASIDAGMGRIASTGAVLTWTLANHDVHRVVSRYGLIRRAPAGEDEDPLAARTRPRGEVDVELGVRRARAALLFLLALPGSVFLYQGEELGLPEVLDLPDEARQDPIWTRSLGQDPGRDGCRVPLPWTSEGWAFGFSPAGSTPSPWLPQPDWFARFAVDIQEADADSTLRLHRRALRARREMFGTGPDLPEWVGVPGADTLALRRGGGLCVINFGVVPVPLPWEWGSVVLASAPLLEGALPGEAAVWLRMPR
jgi:alpha-glucosidase